MSLNKGSAGISYPERERGGLVGRWTGRSPCRLRLGSVRFGRDRGERQS